MNWHTSIPCSVPHSLCCFRFFTVFFFGLLRLHFLFLRRCAALLWHGMFQDNQRRNMRRSKMVSTCYNSEPYESDKIRMMWTKGNLPWLWWWRWWLGDVVDDDNDDDDNNNDQDDDSWLMTRAHDMPKHTEGPNVSLTKLPRYCGKGPPSSLHPCHSPAVATCGKHLRRVSGVYSEYILRSSWICFQPMMPSSKCWNSFWMVSWVFSSSCPPSGPPCPP